MAIYKGFRRGYRGKRILESYFYGIHPFVIFVYFAGLFAATFLFNHPMFVGMVFIQSIVLSLTYENPRKLVGFLKGFGIIAILFVFINPLTNHRGSHILFYLFDNPITLEAFFYGVLNAILVLTLAVLFVPFNVFVNSERFLYLFGRVVPKIAFITDMSIRFQEVFIRRGKEIIEVNGINKERKNSMKEKGKMLETLTSWCLEEGMITSQGLKVKEYGTRKKSHYHKYKFIKSDFIILMIIVLLQFALVWLSSLEVGKFQIYPRMDDFHMTFRDWYGLILLIFYLLLPLLLEFIAIIGRNKK